jgi:hypothetical protein
MSRLRIYWPEGSHGEYHGDLEASGPVTLSFKSHATERSRWTVSDLIARARRLCENNRCPNCSHPVVEPLELADALLSRNRMPIPGTATLVGFRCDRCFSEWPA